jgi:hypothetical protein
MAEGHIDKHRITQADRILLSTSPGFILGFRELCLPLMSGAAYVPVSRDIINNPQQLLEQMDRQRVSIACITPSYLRLHNGHTGMYTGLPKCAVPSACTGSIPTKRVPFPVESLFLIPAFSCSTIGVGK